jgi:hypothetical protein
VLLYCGHFGQVDDVQTCVEVSIACNKNAMLDETGGCRRLWSSSAPNAPGKMPCMCSCINAPETVRALLSVEHCYCGSCNGFCNKEQKRDIASMLSVLPAQTSNSQVVGGSLFAVDYC